MSSFPCAHCKKECLSELLGTYLLVVLGPSSIIISSLFTLGKIESLLFIAASFGTTVGLVILLLGEYSGAVINPAITVGATFAKILHSKYFIPYLFFQITGGLLAGLTLRIIFGSFASSIDLGSTKLGIGVNPILGIILEVLGTFVLTTSALIASSHIKGAKWQALLVGSTLFLLILLIGPLTGAGFNPARSIGPALASGYLGNLYVYFVGPIIGAVLAGLIYRVVRNHGFKSKTSLVCLC
jgi:glycerol uptake facilitator-like aquaporin